MDCPLTISPLKDDEKSKAMLAGFGGRLGGRACPLASLEWTQGVSSLPGKPLWVDVAPGAERMLESDRSFHDGDQGNPAGGTG
jgi:hypothetical protein